jgi:hypothetical protein
MAEMRGLLTPGKPRNGTVYRLSDAALMVWRMTEVTADGSRLVSAARTTSCTRYFPALDEVFSAY